MAKLREALHDAAKALQPATVRGIFYHLVVRLIVAKTEAAYQGTVIRLLGEMREAGEIPFRWITDDSRYRRKPETFSSLAHALDTTARFYRRSLWDEQPTYVEIWCEKVGLSGVLYPVTSEWDVPLMPCRGSPSKTFLFEAAKEIEEIGKPTYIYYLGDFDPSGLAIRDRVARDLQRYAPESEIEFVHLAVTEEQIEEYKLPTRPTKTTDPNAKRFGDRESVEVDAIAAPILREMVRRNIAGHMNQGALDALRRVEAAERSTLASIAGLHRASASGGSHA